MVSSPKNKELEDWASDIIAYFPAFSHFYSEISEKLWYNTYNPFMGDIKEEFILLPDPLWPYLLIGLALFLLGGALAVAIRPVNKALRSFFDGLLRATRIDPDAGKESVSEDELLELMDRSEEAGDIETDEKEMIENVFAFNDLLAEDVMIHRTDMVMLWAQDTDEEIVQTIQSSGLSRFPVYEEDADDVIGILSTREYLLNARLPEPKPLRELLRKPYFVPQSVRADVLFRNMQNGKVHMAIVVDEYGGTSGLVTLEDLLEEIVGNIYDEFDRPEEQEILRLEDNLWRVAGGAELDDIAEALDVEFDEDEEIDTLNGLVMEQLPVIPEDGGQAVVDTRGLHIQVERFADRRVEWALVSKLPNREDEEK